MKSRLSLGLIAVVLWVLGCERKFVPYVDASGPAPNDVGSDISVNADGSSVPTQPSDGGKNDSDTDGADIEECVGFLAPGFDKDGFWTEGYGATVEPTVPGASGIGAAIINIDGICASSMISQTICVGDFKNIGPTQVAVHVKIGGRGTYPGLVIAPFGTPIIGRAPQPIGYPSNSYQEHVACLGEYGFGNAVTFALSGTNCPSNDDMATLHFDDIEIRNVDDHICPAPGEVLNGDFADTNAGWRFENTHFEGALGEITVIGGTYQLHMRGDAGTCGCPRAVGIASPPASIPNVGLRFSLGGPGGNLRVTLYGPVRQVKSFSPDGSTRDVAMCIDAQNQGLAIELEFESTHPTGSCSNAQLREYFIDNLRFETVPGCP